MVKDNTYESQMEDLQKQRDEITNEIYEKQARHLADIEESKAKITYNLSIKGFGINLTYDDVVHLKKQLDLIDTDDEEED